MKMNKKRSQSREVWRRLKKNKLAMLGLIVLIIIVAASVAARLTLDYETDIVLQNMDNKLQPPSAKHWFGTDGFGRDIFKRLFYGGIVSLTIGISVVGLAMLIGSILGAISGYSGGVIDSVIMRIMDIFLAIPSILSAIAIVSVLGPSLVNMIIALSVSSIPVYARLVRSTVLTIKDQEFVEAARAIGCSNSRIILREVLPNTFATLMIQVTLGLGQSIINAAGLSFLGLGVVPPNPEWGAMLSEGSEFIRYTPYLVIFPGAAIMLTVLALNFLGDGMRDALDPKLKN